MRRRPPRSTRTDTLFPYTTLFRSHHRVATDAGAAVTAVGIDLQSGLEIARIHRLACEPGIDGQRVADLGGVAQTHPDGRGEHGRIDITGRAAAHGDVAAIGQNRSVRPEERRVGKGGVSPCRSRWAPYH